MVRSRPFVFALAVSLLAVAACDDDDDPVAPQPRLNIVETAAAAGSFSTLLAAAEAAGLAETLAEDGPFTVFAPTDAAFAALPEGTLETLLEPENRDQLRDILLYHVVAGEVTASEVVELDLAPTLLGPSVTIDVEGGGVVLNGGVDVLQTDVFASNGVIHVIDAVLLPN